MIFLNLDSIEKFTHLYHYGNAEQNRDKMLQIIYQFRNYLRNMEFKQPSKKRKVDELPLNPAANDDQDSTEISSNDSSNDSDDEVDEMDDADDVEFCTDLVVYNRELALSVGTSLSHVDLFLKKKDAKEFKRATHHGKLMVGYAYAAETKCLKHLFKFGCTTRPVDQRIKELSRASVPEPFHLAACVPTLDPFGLEKKIHKHFEHARINGKSTEFFKLKRSEVIQYFHKLNTEALIKAKQ